MQPEVRLQQRGMLPDHIVRRHEDDVVHAVVGGVAAQQLVDHSLELGAGFVVQLDAVQVPWAVHRREQSMTTKSEYLQIISNYLIFSREAQLNKCTFLSVCLSVCPSVSKTEFLIVWSAYDSL